MKLLLWDCRSLWPIFILFCVRLRKFQRWVRLCELTTRWSPGHVKFVCPLIILACWFHGIFRSDLGYESGRKNLWGPMFQRTFTNTKNILKINKKTGSLFCWCVCNCICRQSPQGHSQEEREPLTLAGGLEEAWLLSYVGSHGTRKTPQCVFLPFPVLFRISQFPKDWCALWSLSCRKGPVSTPRNKCGCVLQLSGPGAAPPGSHHGASVPPLHSAYLAGKRVRVALTAVSKDLHVQVGIPGLHKLEKRSLMKANGWKQN